MARFGVLHPIVESATGCFQKCIFFNLFEQFLLNDLTFIMEFKSFS